LFYFFFYFFFLLFFILPPPHTPFFFFFFFFVTALVPPANFLLAIRRSRYLVVSMRNGDWTQQERRGLLSIPGKVRKPESVPTGESRREALERGRGSPRGALADGFSLAQGDGTAV